MITISGKLVLPDNDEVPSINDIAWGLSAQPRFAGHTYRWWTVMHHSLVVYEIIKELPSAGPELLLLALLHDAHEAVTGDIPTTWKSESFKAQQAALDRRIFQSVGLIKMEDERIHRADRMAVVAEAKLFTHPKVIEWFNEPADPYTLEAAAYIADKYHNPLYREKMTRMFLYLIGLHMDHSLYRPV